MQLPAIRAVFWGHADSATTTTCGTCATDLARLMGRAKFSEAKLCRTSLLCSNKVPFSCRAVKAEKYLSLMETGEEQKDALKRIY